MKKLLLLTSLILLTAYAQAASVNVALDAPAFRNGPLYGVPPENITEIAKLTDGITNAQIHADTTPPTGFAYWIDLGISRPLNEIRIFPRRNCCPERFSNVRVSVHTDDNDNIGAEVWHADLFTAGDNPGANTVIVSGTDGVGTFAGRWVKLTALADPVPDYALQVNELQVYADSDAPPNIALGTVATTSAPLWGGGNILALVNGDREGTIHGDATFVPTDPNDQVFHYDLNLGTKATFSVIKVIARQDGCCPERLANYRVSVHNDNGGAIGPEVWGVDRYTDGVANAGSGPGAKDVLTADLDPAGVFAGQWIRIASLDAVVRQYALQMNELEAYGTFSGPITLTIGVQPENGVGYLGRPHTFAVTALAAGGDPASITYQWQKNGVDIVGATAATYETPPVTTQDETNQFKVVVSYPGLPSQTSDSAGLDIDYAFGSDAFANGPLWPNGGWSISRIVDGYHGGPFQGVHGDTTPPTGFAYWFDMHTVVNMSNIVVWPRQDNCCPERLANYRLSIYNDDPEGGAGEVWGADLHTDGSNAGATVGSHDTITAELDPGGVFSGRWVKIASLEDPVQNYALQVTEIEIFGSVPPDIKIVITQQPADTRFVPLRPATFRVTANVLNGDPANLTYQWQRDGVNIPGATAASYTTPPLCEDDAGAKYRVVVSYPGTPSVTSAEGSLVFESNFALGAQAFSNRPLWPNAGWNIQMLTDGNRTAVLHGDVSIEAGFNYTVNLGIPVEIEHIDIYPRQDGCCPERFTNLRVSVHNNSGNGIGDQVWSADLFTDGTNPGSTAGTIVTLTGDMDPGGVFTGQWIKIESLENPVQNYALQMNELEVFGKVRALCSKEAPDGKLILSWKEGTLQSASAITGPWANVQGAVSPFTVSFTGQQQFYRVSVP